MPSTKNEKPNGGSPHKTDQEAKAALDRVRNQCSDFFDAGIILVTREINGKTEFLQSNFGNQFCVRGMFDAFAEGEFGYNKEIDVSED